MGSRAIIKDAKVRVAAIPLPMYHVFALSVNCLLFIELGVTGLLITNPRDIPGFVKELKKTAYCGTLWREHAVQCPPK